MSEFAFDDAPAVPPRFGRSSKLTILDDAVVVKTISGYDDSGATPFGLRMSFQIDKKLSTEGDSARIKVWNLNPKSRALLAERGIAAKGKIKPVHYVRLEAGYSGFNSNNVGVVFIGGIIRATNKRQGPDWITEIEGNAVFAQALYNRLNKAWSNTKTTEIVRELIQAAGWRNVAFTPKAKEALQGKTETDYVSSFPAYSEAQLLLESHGLLFNVDVDGAIVFSPRHPREAKTLLINENSGLIGSPQSTFIGADFRSLLDPRIRPGQLVRVDSDTLRETITDLGSLGRDFSALEVTHSGDTHTDDWFTDVIGRFSPPQEPKVTDEGISGPSIVEQEFE